ncbi:hypothetical protein DPMN_001078 [Dreissena polymorpha]|uniref:Uncharacterized protein n=1 Tax=Dreissena polymorpha TaxID=45954 RepID=A0A9D4RQ29_DREPO|nr:hypothetical protein DPMN_001078 [Dreissena polymorpha]
MIVSSRLFTCFHYIHIEKTAPPPGSHVFPPIITIFKLLRDIYKIHAKKVTSRRKLPCPLGGHVFSPIWTIFELFRDINETNVLTKFHDDWAKIVTSRVFTRNTAPPPQRTQPTYHLDKHFDKCSQGFSFLLTYFELSRGINETNVLTKFYEDRTINVASRVFTRQNVDGIRRT